MFDRAGQCESVEVRIYYREVPTRNHHGIVLGQSIALELLPDLKMYK